MKKALIFDFDGLICDTFEFHRKKMEKFFGVKIETQTFKDMHNGNIYKNSIPEIQNVSWEDYRDFIYEEQIKLNIPSQIKETLLALKGKSCHIISSGGTKNISDSLENNGVKEIFLEILGLEHHKSKVVKFEYLLNKYDLKVEDCLFITDTLGDILEANKVGIETIGVCDFAYNDKEVLAKGKPKKIISDFREILQHI